MKSFWTSLFSAKERFSIEELERLHGILLRTRGTPAEAGAVTEAIRSLAELVIWGEQHDQSMVDYFLTENLLAHFHVILQRPENRSGTVAVQVLQTLSILLQNLRNQQTLFCLFSNDHINKIITLRYDFTDDELLGYYVNLLKTISLRLDPTTVQFFFHENDVALHRYDSRFPLYSEAVKFAGHPDSMVRTAVRTLTLNVYAIELPSLRDFLSRPPADHYFSQLAEHAAHRCRELDRHLASWDESTAPLMAASAVQSCLAEIEDVLSYCNDVLSTGVARLNGLLVRHLCHNVFRPIVFGPLLARHALARGGGEREEGGLQPRLDASATLQASTERETPIDPVESTDDQHRPRKPGHSEQNVGPLCSLYVLERTLQSFTDALFVTFLATALLDGPMTLAAAALTASFTESEIDCNENSKGGGANTTERDVNNTAGGNSVDVLETLDIDPTACRACMLGMLTGDNGQLAAAAIRVIGVLLTHRALPEDVLESIGLLPCRRKRQRDLLGALTTERSDTVSAIDAVGHTNDEVESSSAARQRTPPPPPASSAPTTTLRRYSPRTESLPPHDDLLPSQAAAATLTPIGQANFETLVSALVAALHVELLPPLGAATAAWTLRRLLATGDAGRAASELQHVWRPSLEAAVARRQASVEVLLRGPWADVLGEMAREMWSNAACSVAMVFRSGPGPLQIAAATWLQGMLAQELHWQVGGGVGEPVAAAVSAANATSAAKLACSRMHSLIVALKVRELLESGKISPEPPVFLGPCGTIGDQRAGFDSNPSLRAATSSSPWSREVEEGQSVPIPVPHWRCLVAFSRGGERRVLLGVHPFQKSVERATSANAAGGKLTNALVHAINNNDRENGAESNEAARNVEHGGRDVGQSDDEDFDSLDAGFATSAPAAVILDDVSISSSTLTSMAATSTAAAMVLSAAPLLGTAAAVDESNPRWLHVEVRPQGSALMRILKTSPGMGGEVAAIGQGLGSGHWVLSFEDERQAAEACQELQTAAERARNVYTRALEPLLQA